MHNSTLWFSQFMVNVVIDISNQVNDKLKLDEVVWTLLHQEIRRKYIEGHHENLVFVEGYSKL